MWEWEHCISHPICVGTGTYRRWWWQCCSRPRRRSRLRRSRPRPSRRCRSVRYRSPPLPRSLGALLAASRDAAKGLADVWRGKLSEANGPQLAALIAEYERILETLGKAASHAQLEFAANTTDADVARHHQSIREAGAEIGAELLFMELELANLPQARIDELVETQELAHWMPWLRRVRAMAPHQLDPDMERMLAERAPTGRGAWVRLFDETAASLRFPFQGAEVTEAEILNSLSSTDAAERREAGASLSSTLKANQRLLSLVLNTIAKDKEVEDRWRGFKRPVASRTWTMTSMTRWSTHWSAPWGRATSIFRIAITR